MELVPQPVPFNVSEVSATKFPSSGAGYLGYATPVPTNKVQINSLK
jgi:hypothetical protein